MVIAIELSASQALALADAAERAAIAVRDLLSQPRADFDVAAERVLSKNQELYGRLARCAGFN